MNEEMLKAIYHICLEWMQYKLDDENVDRAEFYDSKEYHHAYTFTEAYRREVLHEKA